MMRNVKRYKALFLVLTLVLCTALLCACTEETGDPVYRVKIVDALGNPYTSGIAVRFMQDGKQAGMQIPGENGVAEKTLPKGDYTVELKFTDADAAYHYDRTDLTLSSDKTELEIILSYALGEQSRTLYAQGKENPAYSIGTGCTYATLTAGERNYFLFAPTEAGTYKFSAVASDVQIGYYGAPHFVQEHSAAEVKDGTFTISVSQSMIGTGDTGTTVLVIGVDANAGAESCILAVERIGDPEHTVSDEPWTEYKTTATLSSYTLMLGSGQKLIYVDITGKTEDYPIVLNETDGSYRFGTADGPVVLINLGKEAPNVSLQKVIQGDGSMGGAPVRKYFYDENGNFVKKEDYTDILVEYFGNMDPNYGVYPLTSDLVYIIQNACSGWWDSTSPDYIFEGCNPELGWMFALCYVTD